MGAEGAGKELEEDPEDCSIPEKKEYENPLDRWELGTGIVHIEQVFLGYYHNKSQHSDVLRASVG